MGNTARHSLAFPGRLRVSRPQHSSIPSFQNSIIPLSLLGIASPSSASAEPRVPRVCGAVLPSIPSFHSSNLAQRPHLTSEFSAYSPKFYHALAGLSLSR